MKDYDYHSLFYYQALGKIQGFREANGNALRPPKELDAGIEFAIGYEPVTEHYQHQYLRNAFVEGRDKFLLAFENRNNEACAIMRISNDGTSAVVYKRAFRKLFDNNYAVAKREFDALMSKFYTLTFEQFCEFNRVDLSEIAGEPHNITIDVGIRKND